MWFTIQQLSIFVSRMTWFWNTQPPLQKPRPVSTVTHVQKYDILFQVLKKWTENSFCGELSYIHNLGITVGITVIDFDIIGYRNWPVLLDPIPSLLLIGAQDVRIIFVVSLCWPHDTTCTSKILLWRFSSSMSSQNDSLWRRTKKYILQSL